MVNTGDPQGGKALHALVAGQNVLQGGVHGMAHVKLAGHVGGRHHDGERLLVRVNLSLEVAAFHPHIINLFFNRLRLVHLGKLFHFYILLKKMETP